MNVDSHTATGETPTAALFVNDDPIDETARKEKKKVFMGGCALSSSAG